jgi:hypothetical protein
MRILQFLPLFLLCALTAPSSAQSECPNRCLHFDGVNDFVQISPAPVQGAGNFTLEGWFLSEDSDGLTGCSGNFERIAGFSGTRFEIGECQGFFTLYSNPTGIVHSGVYTLDGQWHHFAVVKSGNNVKIYIDGSQAIDVTASGHSLGNTFRIGHWVATAFSGQTWEGKLDEFRIWNYARTLEEILATKDCPLQGNELGLVGYYNFDQGIAGGNNPGETVLFDLSPGGNHGMLNNFALTGASSNWVCSEVRFDCLSEGCPSNLARNGGFSQGTPSIFDEDISLATHWGPIWGGSGFSTGDFYHTVYPLPPSVLTPPLPVSQGNYAGFWVRLQGAITVWREGVMNELANPIMPNTGNYELSLKTACLFDAGGTPGLCIYGVNAPGGLGSGAILNGNSPDNLNIFPAGQAVLLASYPLMGPCSQHFQTLSFIFDSATLPAAGITHLFFTRCDDMSGGRFLALDDVCLGRTGLTSTDEWQAPAPKITVFPNPTSGNIALRCSDGCRLSNGSLRIVDSWGRTVWSGTLPASRTEHELSLAAWPAGLYFVTLFEAGRLVWAERVVKY